MQVVACDAPLGPIEPAPLTSLLVRDADGSAKLSAFWSSDDRYYLRADAPGQIPGVTAQWFRIEDQSSQAADLAAASLDGLAARAAVARQFLDVIPMGGSRIAFPVGSTGRTVYRVWRSKGGSSAQTASAGRTRILGVRAGRSLRRQA